MELSGPCKPVWGFAHGLRDWGRKPPWSVCLFSYVNLGSPGLELSVLQGHAEELQGAGGGMAPSTSLLCKLVHCGQGRGFFGGSPYYEYAHVGIIGQIFRDHSAPREDDRVAPVRLKALQLPKGKSRVGDDDSLGDAWGGVGSSGGDVAQHIGHTVLRHGCVCNCLGHRRCGLTQCLSRLR